MFSNVLRATLLVQQLAMLTDSKKVKGSVSGLGAKVSVICLSSLCEFSPGHLAPLHFSTSYISNIHLWVRVIVVLLYTNNRL